MFVIHTWVVGFIGLNKNFLHGIFQNKICEKKEYKKIVFLLIFLKKTYGFIYQLIKKTKKNKKAKNL